MQQIDVEIMAAQYLTNLTANAKVLSLDREDCHKEIIISKFQSCTLIFGMKTNADHSRLLDIKSLDSVKLFIELHGTFNYIISFYATEFLNAFSIVLQNSRMILANSGVFIAHGIVYSPIYASAEVVAKREQYRNFYEAVRNYLPYTRVVPERQRFLDDKVTSAGYLIEESRCYTEMYCFSSVQRVQDYVTDVVKKWSIIPQAMLQNFSKEVIDHMMIQKYIWKTELGIRKMTYQLYNIKAKKI